MPSITEAEAIEYLKTLSNWGRWGDEDERGTLNYITSDKVTQAAALVRSGTVISCQRPMSTRYSEENPQPLQHFMITSGEAAKADKWGGATDWFSMTVHGHSLTHLDALGHIFWDRKLYNGKPSGLIGTAAAARFGGVDAAGGGVVSRGVLLDMPHFRGTPALQPGEQLGPDDLDACAESQGVAVGPGDILIVRTGRDVSDRGHGDQGKVAGLGPSCLPWLHEKQVAMIVSDVTSDAKPSGYERLAVPIHIVGIVAMGLWLVDNAWLENLAATCVEKRRWEFQFVIASLRLPRATGSPVNPLAVF
jgi:kynurenine formamidase